MFGRQGFTLFEVLIALLIVAGAVLLLANAWSGAAARVIRAQQIFEIANLLERKMTEIERQYRDKPSELPEEMEDDFGEKFPQYKWKLKSQKLEVPNLKAMLGEQKDGTDTTTEFIIQQLGESISQAIREVTVTVIWTHPKKPLEYSATTYFVDASKQPTMGAPAGTGSSGSGPQTGSPAGGPPP